MSKWDDNSIQFPRLIAELNAAGAITDDVMNDLCASMDLTPDRIRELIDRADAAWEEAATNQSHT